MKRPFAFVLMLLMIISLAACAKDADLSSSTSFSTGATGTTGEHVHAVGDWKVYAEGANFAPGENSKDVCCRLWAFLTQQEAEHSENAIRRV